RSVSGLERDGRALAIASKVLTRRFLRLRTRFRREREADRFLGQRTRLKANAFSTTMSPTG
ncbi:hypothetical protein, partial [Lacticaseibacillus paracasei]|uniref:hypothetical protein n=1 Tax=Lacticaseibacillus paracasei TaxID=1597 RepID=UPI002889B3AC